MSTVDIVNHEPLPSAAPTVSWPMATTERGSPWGPLIAFLLGLGARLQVQFIGYLPLSEIALLLAFPVLLGNYCRSDVRRRSGWLVPLLFLWLAGAIASDLYRQTDWSLAARGLGRIVVFLVSVPFFAWFLSTDAYRKLTYFAAGTVPSMIVSAFVLRGGSHEGRELVYGKALITWKTHWAYVLLLFSLFLSLYLYKRSKSVAYLAAASLGGLNIVLGARSTGAISLLAVPVCIMRNWFAMDGSAFRKRVGLVKSAVVASILVVASYGLITGYSRLAETGVMGRVEQDKYLQESENELGIIGSSRLVYVVGGLVAVAESPFFGYGSWPLDKQGFYYRACEILEIKPLRDYYSRGYPLIPGHSCIINALVEHGILSTPFWLYAIWLSIRAILRPIGNARELQLWVLSTAILMVWNVLFSPIAYRMENSMVLVVYISQYLDWVRGKAAVAPVRRPAVRLPSWDAPAAAF